MNKIATKQEFGIDRRQLIAALRKLRDGDFSVRLSEDEPGRDMEIAALFNEVVGLNQSITEEFERLSRVVGKEGKIGHRAKVRTATGGWETKLRAINELIDDMVQPTTEVARVIGAVAKGDLSQSMVVEIDGRPLRGEFLRMGKVVNTMVEQLGSFTSEVTRVAREVGTEGKLGGQAQVKGVAGTWKDLTDNVNSMAANLTGHASPTSGYERRLVRLAFLAPAIQADILAGRQPRHVNLEALIKADIPPGWDDQRTTLRWHG